MTARGTKTLQELAEIVASRATRLNECFTPSLREKSTPPKLHAPETSYSQEIRKVQGELSEALQEMHAIILGPEALLLSQCLHGIHGTHTLRTIYTFRIPLHVPLDGSISYGSLAQSVHLEEDKLRRILAYAYTMYMFRETSEGHVAHSATSRLLATNEEAMAWLGHTMEDVFPGSARQSEALLKWFSDVNTFSAGQDDTLESARSGVGYHFDLKRGFFAYLAEESPSRIARFSGAMRFFQSSPMSPGYAFADLFDWSSLGTGIVCDVGGGSGHKCKIISRKAPKLHFVVQDLPEVTKGAIKDAVNDTEIAQLCKDGRLSFEEYDFFTQQTVREAKAYLFGHIFHDWGDSDCIRILENVVPSMSLGSYLIINDFVLPRPGSGNLLNERTMRALDLQMMVGVNARERSLEHWKDLIAQGSGSKLSLCSSRFDGLVFLRVA